MQTVQWLRLRRRVVNATLKKRFRWSLHERVATGTSCQRDQDSPTSVTQEASAAIAKEEVGTAGMVRPEMPFRTGVVPPAVLKVQVVRAVR